MKVSPVLVFMLFFQVMINQPILVKLLLVAQRSNVAGNEKAGINKFKQSIMYENKKQALAPVKVYYRRLLRNFIYMLFFLALCLAMGVIGYHYTAQIAWLDAVHNASMILSGMGPVVEIKTTSGKWFSSFYALFSGIAFITNISFLLAPAVHRFFHKLHLEQG